MSKRGWREGAFTEVNKKAFALMIAVIVASLAMTAAVKVPPRVLSSAQAPPGSATIVKQMTGKRYTLPRSLIFTSPNGGEKWLPMPPDVTPGRAPALIFNGDRTRRRVALTFDSDVAGVNGPVLIDTLYNLQAPATLFVCGEWAKNHPELLKSAADRGFEIGSHSLGHPNFTLISGDEMARQLIETRSIVEEVTGQPMAGWFRPPYGSFNQQTIDVAAASGYAVVIWDCDSADWTPVNTRKIILARATDGAQNGSIILMHFDGAMTPDLLTEIVNKLRAKGFELTTVTGLFAQ